MINWNPEKYLQYGDYRTRPAAELLSRVDLAAPAHIYDLGCGPGNSTKVLRERWSEARITGIDNDEEMLRKARTSGVKAQWTHADLGGWAPEISADLIFSNAALHWLGDHEALFLKLMDAVRPGGVVAVQMPRNFTSPCHTIIQQVVETGPWGELLRGVRDFNPVARPEEYYALLSGHAAALDIWETEYVHVLHGEEPVYDWIRGTALNPYLSVLEGKDRLAFIDMCKERLAHAYCKRADGTTLFLFRRLFIVATVKE